MLFQKVTRLGGAGLAIACALLFSSVSTAQAGFQPLITAINPTIEATTGGTLMTINGENFGVTSIPQSIEIGGVPCSSPTWVSSTEVTCIIPPGAGINLNVEVTNANGTSAPNSLFRYEAPTVAGVSFVTASTAGGNSLTVIGSNFGPTGSGQAVTINGNPCTVVSADHTSIDCLSAGGFGINRSVVVTVGSQFNTANSFYDYDPPTISSISPNTGPQTGGPSITIIGTNLGTTGQGQTVFFGPNGATGITASHTSLQCTLPANAGGVFDVVVGLGGQSATEVNGFDYNVVPVELSVFSVE